MCFRCQLIRNRFSGGTGTPLHLDMRAVLDKIAESLAGDIEIGRDRLAGIS